VLHVLDGEKFIPDVCVNQASEAAYLTTPLLLAVEIWSDAQSRQAQRRKALAYIQHGVSMVVLVLLRESVEVYRPGCQPLVLRAGDTLDGDDVLPGFKLPLNTVLA
jgi:Uma2 family endonuclease